MLPIISANKKNQRRPQNPWPKYWGFPKLKHFTVDFDLELQHPYFSKKLLMCTVGNENSLRLIKKNYPKNLKGIAFKDINPGRKVLKRLKLVNTMLLYGNTTIKYVLPRLKTLIISEVYNTKGGSHYKYQVKKLKTLKMLMLKNVNKTYLSSIVKSMKPLKQPSILHLKFKNDNFPSNFNALIPHLQVLELRIELKRISLGQEKMIKLFQNICKIKTLKRLKLDLYDSIHLNQANFFTDLSSYLEKLYANLESVDIRVSQNLMIKIPPPADYLKNIDFLAVNMKSRFPYEYEEISKQRLELQKCSHQLLMLNIYNAGYLVLSPLLKKLTNLVSLELIIGENYSASMDDFWVDLPGLRNLRNFSLHYHLLQNKNILPLFASKLGSLSQLRKVVVEFEGSFQFQYNRSIIDFFKSIKNIEDLVLILHSNNLSTMTAILPLYESIVNMQKLRSFTILINELSNQHLDYLQGFLEVNTGLESLTIVLDDSSSEECWNIPLKKLKDLKKLYLKINLQLDGKSIEKIISDINELSKLKKFDIELKTTMYDTRLFELLKGLDKLENLESVNMNLDVQIMGVTDMQWDLRSELKSLNTRNGQSKESLEKGQKGFQKGKTIKEKLLPVFMEFWGNKPNCKKLAFSHKTAPFALTLRK